MRDRAAHLVVVAACCTTARAAQDVIAAVDLARIRELYHLTDGVGERLWPGFDVRKIPIAVNHQDRQELLVGHSHPPAEFAAHGDVDGVPAFLRDGCTRYGPKGGGWAVELGGEKVAYVSTKRDDGPTDEWLSLLLHECFHVYQARFQPKERQPGSWQEPPEDDAVYNARIGLESRVLRAALDTKSDAEIRRLGASFVAVRHARRQRLSPGLLRHETSYEYSEGTATYVQARLMQVLHRELWLVPAGDADPHYHAFHDADKRYQEFLDRIVPAADQPITFFHAQYQNGMAQCLLLDRLRKGWKEELRKPGSSQFALLEREFPPAPERETELLAAAERDFGYAELLAKQQQVVATRVALVRGFVEQPGRRYRLFHGERSGSFNWKPVGPVYNVPQSLMPLAHQATVWAGGITAFEKPGLEFRSQKGPVIFRQDYLEWIDPAPAADGSDLKIEARATDDDVHTGLQLQTKGFVLRADRARVVRGQDVVEIHPLPAAGR